MNQIKKIIEENLLLVFGFVVIYLLFQHVDLAYTARASINLFHTNYIDFYDETVRVCNWPKNGLNYLPSTYILFALWGLPLRVLGLLPAPGQEVDGSIFWFKLLPIVFYFLSGFLMKQLAESILKNRESASWVAKLWLVSPLAFFSQFIFCQYDIFTLFFTLLGLVYYFKKDISRFSLLFGVALTFKYFPVFVFMPLLLMVEKRITALIKYGILFSIPMLLIAGPFAASKSPAFFEGVLGFGAAHRVFGIEMSNGSSNFNILFFLWFLLCAYVYLFEESWNAFKEKAIRYSSFAISGVFFFIFWHPQWLIFLSPFMHLSCMYKKALRPYLSFQMALAVALAGVSVHLFNNNVDQTILKGGILGFWFPQVWTAKVAMMSNFFYPRDPTQWLSFFNALLVIGVIFSHRFLRSNAEKVTEADFSDNRLMIRAYTGVSMWAFPTIALICYVITFVRWTQMR